MAAVLFMHSDSLISLRKVSQIGIIMNLLLLYAAFWQKTTRLDIWGCSIFMLRILIKMFRRVLMEEYLLLFHNRISVGMYGCIDGSSHDAFRGVVCEG